MERTNIYINRRPDPDGNRHEFVSYDYGDYSFRKEWYMNFENEYVMGLTLFKNGEEIFHAGTANEEQSDEEWIKFVENFRKRLPQILEDEERDEKQWKYY